ncbi:MAG: M56 family metallopeptidase [Evtepia sp.]
MFTRRTRSTVPSSWAFSARASISPWGWTEQERRYVLLHEQAHIRRWDHRFKPLAYALLCLHWFDPVLWIAYRLLCLDIEMATDQAVLRRLDHEEHTSPTESRRCPAPPEPGPAGPQRRPPRLWGGGREGAHRLLLRYRRPVMGVLVAAALVCLVLGVGFVGNHSTAAPALGLTRITQGTLTGATGPVAPTGGPAAGSCRASEPHKEKQLHPLRRPRKAGGDGQSLQPGRSLSSTVSCSRDGPRPGWSRSATPARRAPAAAPCLFPILKPGTSWAGTGKISSRNGAPGATRQMSAPFPDRAGQIYAARVSDAADPAACEALLKTMDLERTLGPYTVTSQPEGQGCNIVLALTRQPRTPPPASGPTAGGDPPGQLLPRPGPKRHPLLLVLPRRRRQAGRAPPGLGAGERDAGYFLRAVLPPGPLVVGCPVPEHQLFLLLKLGGSGPLFSSNLTIKEVPHDQTPAFLRRPAEPPSPSSPPSSSSTSAPASRAASWKASPSLKFLSWRRTAGRSPSQMA